MCVLVIDHLSLRRAVFKKFITDWADQHELEIYSLSQLDLSKSNIPIQPRIIILNVCSQQMDSNEFHKQLALSQEKIINIPTVIFSDQCKPEYIIHFMNLGIKGFIPFSSDPDLTLQALTFLINGGTYFPVSLLSKIEVSNQYGIPLYIDHYDESDTAKSQLFQSCKGFTNRQFDVLTELILGKTNKEIARELDLTEATVKVHMRKIMKKFGVTNRTQAAIYAKRSLHLHS